MKQRRRASSRGRQLHCSHRPSEAENLDDTFEVVGQHVQAHFSGDMDKSARLEVRRSHPVLECAEHMLDCAPPYGHGVELAIQS